MFASLAAAVVVAAPAAMHSLLGAREGGGERDPGHRASEGWVSCPGIPGKEAGPPAAFCA